MVDGGFYDGIVFHRIVKDFVIQGGDPTGTGYHGSGKNIKGEFYANGYTANTLAHKRGTISMARGDSYNSASSQFFVCLNDITAEALDGKYAAFGEVVEGMETVDAIASTPLSGGAPIDPPKITKAYIFDGYGAKTE